MAKVKDILQVLESIEHTIGTLTKRVRAEKIKNDEENIEFSDTEDEEDVHLSRYRPRRKRRCLRVENTALEFDAWNDRLGKIVVKWHEDDGLYLALSDNQNPGEHRVRWLKEMKSTASAELNFSTWQYCDWPQHFVDSCHSKQHACEEEDVDQATDGGFFELTTSSSPRRFVIEPVLYEYDHLTETDFSPLLLYISETLPEDTLGSQQRHARIIEYRRQILQIVDGCYGKDFLVFSGTREIDRESDEELLNSVLEQPDECIPERTAKTYVTTVCDACNKRKKCASSFKGLYSCVMCDTCHERIQDLHRLKVNIMPKFHQHSTSEVFNKFMYAFLDFKETL